MTTTNIQEVLDTLQESLSENGMTTNFNPNDPRKCEAWIDWATITDSSYVPKILDPLVQELEPITQSGFDELDNDGEASFPYVGLKLEFSVSEKNTEVHLIPFQQADYYGYATYSNEQILHFPANAKPKEIAGEVATFMNDEIYFEVPMSLSKQAKSLGLEVVNLDTWKLPQTVDFTNSNIGAIRSSFDKVDKPRELSKEKSSGIEM